MVLGVEVISLSQITIILWGHYVVVHRFQLGMDTQTTKNMEKDTIANGFTIAGVFSYLMKFQAEITILVLLTGLLLNLIRIYQSFNKKKNQKD